MLILTTIKEKSKIKLLLLIIFFIIVSSVLTFSLPVFIMQLILGLITIPLIMKKEYKIAKLYVFIFIISICFVYLIYMVNQATYGLPYYVGGSDDLQFEIKGELVSNSNIYNPSKILGEVVDQYDNTPFFYVYIAVLIKFSNLFGSYSTFLPRIINVYYLIWICMIFGYLIKKYANFTDKKTYISLALFAFTPNIQYINSHVFRDTFNLLQVFLIIYLFDKLFSNKAYMKKILYVLLLAILIYTTYYTRQNALVFAGALSLLILAEKLKIKKRYIFILIIPIVGMSNLFKFIKLGYFIETYSNYVLNIAGNGFSSYVFRQKLLPFGVVLRALYAFATPFPNFFGLFRNPSIIAYDFTLLLIYIGVLIQILAIPFIFKRIYKFDWLSLSFLIWFLAIIITTFTFRHVIFYYPFMVALGVDGYMSTSKMTRVKTLLFSGVMEISLALIYMFLKLFS